MKKLLKFITCGSVDDGKSTLIGHMLYDAKLLFADQKQALEMESKVGSREGKIDYSLLLDGLMAEREQGITIDVAYRYFSTERRSFIVADTPGHEQYTRNMAVGASFADLSVILVDVTKGVLPQTRRHALICKLMGIKYFVFVINKMDLIKYNAEKYAKVERDIRKLAIDIEIKNVKIIPVSATEGDNVTNLSAGMKWYDGGTLLNYLETVDIEEEKSDADFVLPVQRVCRPHQNFRGFQGEVAEGILKIGDEITVLPSKEQAAISKILVTDKESNTAQKGDPVTVCLDREVDVSRGCVITKDKNLKITNMINASVLWMDDEDLVSGKNYIFKLGTTKTTVTVMKIKYKLDIYTGEHLSANKLSKNELANCDLVLTDKIVCDKFDRQKDLGSFILIDRVSHMTSACGTIQHSLRRSDNIFWQKTDITRDIRAKALGQKPKTLWFTGLSGSGKSTLANELEKLLHLEGIHTMMLDGDNVRMGLNKNLGFTEEDRIENIRRIAEVSKLMNDAGLVVLTSFISPYRADRQRARQVIGNDDFIEIYVSTPLEVCEQRDVKGLYKKARNGEIPNFTGISSVYEIPQNPEITIDTSKMSLKESLTYLKEKLRNFLE